MKHLTLAVSALALAGCQALNSPPPVDVAQPTSVRPLPLATPAVSNGAIFQSGQYRPLFEDYRARLVGDTLTVQIVEAVSASQKSNSSVDKSGKLEASVTALPDSNPARSTAPRRRALRPTPSRARAAPTRRTTFAARSTSA